MKRQHIPEWDGCTDYRTPIFEEYEFNLDGYDPKTSNGIYSAGLNYAREIVGDNHNSKWVERRKLTDAFEMGIEYAKRYLCENNKIEIEEMPLFKGTIQQLENLY